MKHRILLPLLLAGALLLAACGSAPAGVTVSGTSAGKAGSPAAAENVHASGVTVSGTSSSASSPASPASAATASSASSASAGFGVLNSFTTQDLEGNTVSQSILKNARLTMINVWGTFCGPCIHELPYLGELNKEYKDRGFQVIGIPLDTLAYDGSISASQVKTAAEIVSKTGADYTHLLPEGELLAIAQQVLYYPTTIFVDENGTQVGQAYSGSRSKEDWAKIIDSYLANV